MRTRITYALDLLRQPRPVLPAYSREPANVNRIIPFDELPEPHFPLCDDSDLESFLRRNNLTAALEEYIRAQRERAA